MIHSTIKPTILEFEVFLDYPDALPLTYSADDPATRFPTAPMLLYTLPSCRPFDWSSSGSTVQKYFLSTSNNRCGSQCLLYIVQGTHVATASENVPGTQATIQIVDDVQCTQVSARAGKGDGKKAEWHGKCPADCRSGTGHYHAWLQVQHPHHLMI